MPSQPFDRRKLLQSGGAAVLASLAGCGSLTGSNGNRIQGSVIATGTHDQSRRETDPSATITFDRDLRKVTVRGAISTNPCYYAALKQTAYDRSADELVVKIGEKSNKLWNTCGDAGVWRGYEVTVAFTEAVPETVQVIEKGRSGERGRTRATPPPTETDSTFG
jgi:hypothetical protein